MESFTDHKVKAEKATTLVTTGGAAVVAAFVFGGFIPAIAVGGAMLAVNYIRK